jgi:alpha,alpha-trehalase
MFTDLLLPDLQHSPADSLAGVFPLFLDIAGDAQAGQTARRLSADYAQTGGWLTTLTPSAQQWDAPNGWAPLQWVCYRGLSNYGFHDDARTGAMRWLRNNLSVYAATGTLMEKYNVVEIGKPAGGGEYGVQDGFGWTNGVLLRLMDELGAE